MLYKLQPFSTSKELGREYNKHVAMVPNPDDFVLILDYDCMILTTETYTVIEAAIERYPTLPYSALYAIGLPTITSAFTQ